MNSEQQKKKAYQKPEITTIDLKPEEALLVGCKISSGSGPGGTCAVTCSTAGS